MVPISLYVSIELVKLVQVFFIQEDVDLIYTDPITLKQHKMMCRALNITEDLGQVAVATAVANSQAAHSKLLD